MNVTYHVGVVFKIANPRDMFRMDIKYGVHVLDQFASHADAVDMAEHFHQSLNHTDVKTWYGDEDWEYEYKAVPVDEAERVALHILPDNMAMQYRDDIGDGDIVMYAESVSGEVDDDDLRNSDKAYFVMKWEGDTTTPILATNDAAEAFAVWREQGIVTSHESFLGELGGMYDRIGTTEDGTRYGILRFRDRVWANEREREAGIIG